MLIFAGFNLSTWNTGVVAAESEVLHGITGYWNRADGETGPAEPWSAEWIWLKEEQPGDVMLARCSFLLNKAPEKAILQITASSLYQLYVNGQYVCRGPARSAPHHQSFDVLSINGLLKEGRNVLAVRVHYQRGTVSYHHSGRAGLLAQLDGKAGGEPFTIQTGPHWKVLPDASWDSNVPHISRFHLEVPDRVDLRNLEKGWQSVEFDDTDWQPATSLIRNVGWPEPQANDKPGPLIPPWTAMVQRDIPYLKETEIRAADLIEVRRLNSKEANSVLLTKRINPQISNMLANYQAEAGPLTLPAVDASDAWFLLFDLGAPINGMPVLEAEGPAGTVVEMHCAPYMVDDRFTARIVDSNLIDRIVLSGSRDKWEGTYFKPARFLGIVVPGGAGQVKIYRAGMHRIEYPFEKQGYFHAPENPLLEAFWEAAAKTIRVCKTDAYTDNYRERRQYVQTGYYASLGNYAIFGDTALQRRYLLQAAQEQEANGMMPAYAPRHGEDFMVILDSNAFWIRGLRNYLLYSGDEKTALELLPAARKLMALFHSYTNEWGLLDSPPYAYWLDHALNDRRGANVCMNGHYLGTLEDFAQLLEWLDQPGSDIFNQRANLLRKSLREQAWDPDRKLFADAIVDGQRSYMFSEQANAMMLALQVASPEQAKWVAEQLIEEDEHNFIRRASGITMVTPAMSYFLHAGLCKNGYMKDSLRMFQERFKHMLAPDMNGTLWEEWWRNGTGRTGTLQLGRTRSDAQTESTFPPALFTEYILGIRPMKPGMKEVELFRSESGLNEIKGAIPSPHGILSVELKLNQKERRELTVKVPGGMQVHVDIASLGLSKGGHLVLNGEAIEPEGEHLTLQEGMHHVQF
ncbi:MAG: alpha-L-rhamnosidase N-terminal domain-containing protein [Verrucomicrobiae bacterium]|nr:alpha-L-rhamnosidase N-terminal domain-containing protein [Verrucomicrobiae bacterium]